MWRRARRLAYCTTHGVLAISGLGVSLAFNAFRSAPTSPSRLIAAHSAALLARLGGAYVKLGQLLATRADILGAEAIQELQLLLDELPPLHRDVAASAWRDAFDEEIEARFRSFSETSIASASIAAVFRATLPDRTEVAVKVRRPGIGEIIDADLALIALGARILARFPAFRRVPVEATIAEMSACIRGQLDFRRESRACERLRRALRWESRIVIPRLNPELCSDSILTMEFIDGLSPRPRTLGADRADALRAALCAFYRMLFVEGLIHCDLHPANLHLKPNGDAVLLDFGFTAELDETTRLRFAEFFYAMATGDGARCAAISVEMALDVSDAFDHRAFEAEMIRAVDKAHGATASDFQVGAFVKDMFDAQRHHGVTSTSAFTMIVLSLIVFEGLIKQISPEIDFQKEALPYIFRASVDPNIQQKTRTAHRAAPPGSAPVCVRCGGSLAGLPPDVLCCRLCFLAEPRHLP